MRRLSSSLRPQRPAHGARIAHLVTLSPCRFLILFRLIALWRFPPLPHSLALHVDPRPVGGHGRDLDSSSLVFYGMLWLLGKGEPRLVFVEHADQSTGARISSCFRASASCYRQVSDRVLLGFPGGPEAAEHITIDPAIATTRYRRTAFARQPDEVPRPRRRALIVGAGDAGEAVARDLLRRQQEGIVPVGFVDDDPLKRRIRIHGLPVLGRRTTSTT